MSGYTDKSLVEKLGIRSGMRVLIEEPPDNYDQTLGAFPDDVEFVNEIETGEFDFIQSFERSQDELAHHFDALAHAMKKDGMLWISWPKKSSPLAGDLSEDCIRDLALERGLVDVKVCAIDDDWSGLKLVWRKEYR